MERIKQALAEGRTALGIEFGSTRIKAVLVDEESHPIAQGGYDWENRYVDNIWSYTMEDIWKGLQGCYREMAEDLGMDALVEAHDAQEVERALKSGARIIGVNNRDLKTFEVDMANSINLRKLAPENVIFVSESGIRTSEDIQRLHDNKIEAVLVGETLMRSPDKKAALEELNGAPLTED